MLQNWWFNILINHPQLDIEISFISSKQNMEPRFYIIFLSAATKVAPLQKGRRVLLKLQRTVKSASSSHVDKFSIHNIISWVVRRTNCSRHLSEDGRVDQVKDFVPCSSRCDISQIDSFEAPTSSKIVWQVRLSSI